MSVKNLDNHNRWRSKTIAFRVSPEENEQIEIAVRLSGLTKQDYITRRLLDGFQRDEKDCPDSVCANRRGTAQFSNNYPKYSRGNG